MAGLRRNATMLVLGGHELTMGHALEERKPMCELR